MISPSSCEEDEVIVAIFQVIPSCEAITRWPAWKWLVCTTSKTTLPASTEQSISPIGSTFVEGEPARKSGVDVLLEDSAKA